MGSEGERPGRKFGKLSGYFPLKLIKFLQIFIKKEGFWMKVRNLFLMLVACSSNVLANPVSFRTIEQAQKYCPSPNGGITFNEANPAIPNSAGFFSGEHNGVHFFSDTQAQPKRFDKNGVVEDMAFREVNGQYGYVSGDTTTCLYKYENFVDNSAVTYLRSSR